MRILRIGHSPDADDAFMFYALATGKVSIEGYEIQQVLEDIESLNQRALRGELEVTAVSAAAYPSVADKYRIMVCGASMGRSYGPIVISTAPQGAAGLEFKKVAIPGENTTAYLLLRIYLAQPFTPVFVPFDAVGETVRAGEADAGLVIHEGQITWKEQGYAKLLDLGQAWGEETGLPIPLGLDIVRRDLGDDLAMKIARALQASVHYAIAHEEEALDYALPYGRGVDRDTCRRFVRMYVNEDTVSMGEDGRAALEALYARAHERGLIPTVPPLDILQL